MRFEIKALQKKLGVTVIYVTHDQAEAMAMSDRIVVMHQGVIQQVAEPMDIYERPANQTVADFIGLVNLLPGEAADGVVRLAAGGEIKQETSCRGPVQVAVRPEKIRIASERPRASQNLFTGKVREIAYFGSYNTFIVEMPGGRTVKITATNTTRQHTGDITWDDAVFFWWDDSAPVVLTQ